MLSAAFVAAIKQVPEVEAVKVADAVESLSAHPVAVPPVLMA